MSFSRKVKEELVAQMPRARHCQLAEFSAIFSIAGRIKRYGKNGICLEIHTENLTVAKKSYMLIIDLFRTEVEIRVRTHRAQKKTESFLLKIVEEKFVIQIMKALKLMTEQGELQGNFCAFQHRLVQNACCKRAFLRGVFLTAGSITNPEKAYHLEIAVLSEQLAHRIREEMIYFKLDAKIVMRKKYHVVYLKEGAQIVDFLNVVEAHVALMNFENIRIVKEVRNSVNRQVNCETANIGKTVTAAAKQIEDIHVIEKFMGLQQLSSGLRSMAELRLEYPDSSLQELGKMLDPPIGKSGVNHRLRKLGEIAERLRERLP